MPLAKSSKIIASAVAAILIVGTGIWQFRRSRTPPEVLGKVRRGDLLEAVYGIGTVTATRIYQLKVGVTSTITRLHVREGDPVKKGQRLIDLEGTAGFSAPFAGIVTALPFRTGETVFPQVPILTVTDLSDRYLVVSLEQQAAVRVRSGQTAVLSFDSMRDQRSAGKVTAVYANEGQFLVRIETDQLPSTILPGMTADVAVGIRTHSQAMILPTAAVSGGQVLALRQGKATPVTVELGLIDGEQAELAKGDVSEGESLVKWGK